ncbi:BolA/IbaG family iron-sulfur metabolism protein [Accumulibacter sp.]|uniref:BolA family protein n=1 Tax=Accumulibacter sp. TaxID=2053492 RepID=UPI00260C526F|nr:BolA/IbaG family iron-sulfur metabolism protein [Accumulibacter sp.]
MMHPERVSAIIAAALPCEHLKVIGDGQHFEALIVSAQFVGKTRVQRQQQVNQILREHFDSGELHALSMKTQTPDEWSANGG